MGALLFPLWIPDFPTPRQAQAMLRPGPTKRQKGTVLSERPGRLKPCCGRARRSEAMRQTGPTKRQKGTVLSERHFLGDRKGQS